MSDADPLAQLDRWLVQALEQLGPARRKAVLTEIGRELRKRNQRRIAAQSGPDGEAWEPRKPDRHGNLRKTETGKVRRTARMLLGLREARRMVLTATPAGMELGYSGRNARLAEVHHYGQVDAVDKAGKIQTKYPARPLLGLAPEDVAWVEQRLAQLLTVR